MKIINEINEELQSLTFYYNKDSFVRSDGNTENGRGNIVSFVKFCNEVHTKNRFLPFDEQKSLLPSQFLTLKRSVWESDCCMLFIDIDTTEGVDRFISESDRFFKTFKNVAYIQKSISGKLHICVYSKKESIRNRPWDVTTWKTGWIFWNGYINEWFKTIYNIDYSEIAVNAKGDKALDNHMYNIAQPLKMSENDVIVNPYFSIRESIYKFNYEDDRNEIIRNSRITTVKLIENYRNKLKCAKPIVNQGSMPLADRYECNVSQFSKEDLVVDNNTRAQMCFALKRAGFSNDDIMKLMYERTTSANAKKGKSNKEWNKSELEKSINQANTYQNTNPGVFNAWANKGIYLLKKIDVKIDAIFDKREIPDVLDGFNSDVIQLTENEYISDNNIQTIVNSFNKSEYHNVIMSAPTGAGKSVSTVKIANEFMLKGFCSIILCPFNELINQYCADNQSLIPVRDMTTVLEEYKSYIMSYDRFNMRYYHEVLRLNYKTVLLIDEVHEMSQSQTYRSRFIELQKQIATVIGNKDVYTAFISATIDPLTLKLFGDKSHKISFIRKDLREFELQLTDEKLERIAYTAMKSKWATKISIYSDFMNASNICTDEEIGYGCSENNSIHGISSILPEIKNTGMLTKKINIFTNAGFAGLNIKNQNERFLIIIDYSFLKSCADVRQILGRYRNHNNEFVVYVVLNDRKWMQFANQGFLECDVDSEDKKESEEMTLKQQYDMIDKYSATFKELFDFTTSGQSSSELDNTDELSRLSKLPKDIIKYFAEDHIHKNQYTEEYETYLVNLIHTLTSYGIVHFSNEIRIGISMYKIENEDKFVTRLMDRFLESKNYSLEEIKKTCGMKVFDNGKCQWNNGFGNVLIDFSAKINKMYCHVLENEYKKFETLFNEIYGIDNKSINEMFGINENEYINARDAFRMDRNKWNAVCTNYLIMNNAICDILYRDPILSTYSASIIKLWKQRTERSIFSFTNNVKNYIIGYHLNDSDYERQINRIKQYMNWLGEMINKCENKKSNRATEYRADYKQMKNKMDAIEEGRNTRGDEMAFWNNMEKLYASKTSNRRAGNSKGGKKGSVVKKSESGSKGGLKGRKCSVFVVYHDHTEVINAESRKEMIEMMKNIYVGASVWSEREFNDFFTGKKDKLSCNLAGFYVLLNNNDDFTLDELKMLDLGI